MSVTVGSILKMEAMKRSSLLAGESGLDRMVTSATVLDAPDAVHWLKGNELAFTSTYPLQNLTSGLDALVEEFVQRNVSGLGVKLNRYMTIMPADMLERADSLGFPIIALPEEIAWIDLITPIMLSILDTEARDLIRSEEVQTGFTNILLSNPGLEDIARLLHDFVGNPVVILVQGGGEPITVPAPAPFDIPQILHMIGRNRTRSEIGNPQSGVRRVQDSDVCAVFIPFTYEPGVDGYIVVVEQERPLSKADLDCLRHAKNAIALKMLQIRAELSVERQKYNEFVGGLIDKNASTSTIRNLIARGGAFGFDLADQYTAVVIQFFGIDGEPFNAVSNALRAQLSDRGKLILGVLEHNRIIALFPAGEPEGDSPETLPGVLRALLQSLQDRIGPLRWSAGISHVNATHHLARAYEQAEQALVQGDKKLGPGRIQLYDDTGLYRLFSHAVLHDDIRRYVTEWLDPLLTYDRSHQTKLIETLRVFIDCNGNYRETSRALHLHHNTVRYRISLILRLTGRNALLPKVRLHYQLALVLLQRIGDPPSP